MLNRLREQSSRRGITIEYGGDWLTYVRDRRKMSITVDSGVREVTIFADTVGRWDDALDTRVSEEEQHRIISEIRDQLMQRGVIVRLSA